MKHLILLILTVFSLSATARGPGDGPIVPWPTSVSLHNITCEDLQGEWVAYSHNTIWFVNLEMRPDALSTIRMTSNALFTHKAKGWLEPGDRLFYGKLAMDSNHIYDVIVFRDSEGTKIRVIQGANKFFDLKLYTRK